MKSSTLKSLLVASSFLFLNILQAQTLLAYYPFSGNTLDYSANGYHGLNTNAVLATDRFGMANKAYSFDGDAIITIPTGGLQINTYTYSIWVKVASYPTSGSGAGLLSIGNGGALGDQNVFIGNQYSTPVFHGLGGGSYTNPSVYPLPPATVKSGFLPQLNQWYHLVLVRDTVKMKLTLFIDGVKITDDILRVSKAGYSSPCIGAIGARAPGNMQYFKGSLDDIRIFDYALTDSAVIALYHSDKNSTTGLKEATGFYVNSLTVYPNPSIGKISITTNQPAGGLRVYNAQGSIIYSKIDFAGKVELEGLTAGVYFCCIEDENGNREMVKFLVAE